VTTAWQRWCPESIIETGWRNILNKHEQTYWTVVSHELHEHSQASRIKQDAGSYNLISHENEISPNQIRQFERLKWCKHLGGVTQSKKFHPLSLLGSTGPQTKWCPEWSKCIDWVADGGPGGHEVWGVGWRWPYPALPPLWFIILLGLTRVQDSI
jgi:hypothetical protein